MWIIGLLIILATPNPIVNEQYSLSLGKLHLRKYTRTSSLPEDFAKFIVSLVYGHFVRLAGLIKYFFFVKEYFK